MTDNHHLIAETQSMTAKVVFTLLWLLTCAAFLFVAFFTGLLVIDEIRTHGILLIKSIVVFLLFVPVIFLFLKGSLTTFLNRERNRSNQAAFAKSILMVIATFFLTIVFAYVDLLLVCG
jgi:hypothetical protein